MKCTKARMWISLRLDDALPAWKNRLLHQHLVKCAPCRTVHAEWQSYAWRIHQDAKAAPGQPTPEAAWQDIRRAIRLQKGERPGAAPILFHWSIQAAGVVLGAAVILVGAFLLGHMPAREGASVATVSREAPQGAVAGTVVEWVETELADTSPMVYEDAEVGMTVIWLVANEDKRDAGS